MIQEVILWWLILLKKIAEKIKNENWKGAWGYFQTVAVAGQFLYYMKPSGCAAQERVLWSRCPPADHIAGFDCFLQASDGLCRCAAEKEAFI